MDHLDPVVRAELLRAQSALARVVEKDKEAREQARLESCYSQTDKIDYLRAFNKRWNRPWNRLRRVVASIAPD